MLSLLTHETQQTIGQIGVCLKENEIPAALRLFKQTQIAGLTIIADALHTQKDTVEDIRAHHAHYVLIVKKNQKELYDAIKTAMTDTRIKTDTATEEQHTRGRSIETTVTLTHDPDICRYISSLGWTDVSCVGVLHRFGTRTKHGETKTIDETVYFISSRNALTAKQALGIIRGHWKIENNLHWQKDYTYDEDHQTVRLGNAPQVMSFLRSMAISLFKVLDIASVTEAVTNLRMSPSLHHRFLAIAQVA
jgi:predicted transposase YbfD/YdcC